MQDRRLLTSTEANQIGKTGDLLLEGDIIYGVILSNTKSEYNSGQQCDFKIYDADNIIIDLKFTYLKLNNYGYNVLTISGKYYKALSGSVERVYMSTESGIKLYFGWGANTTPTPAHTTIYGGLYTRYSYFANTYPSNNDQTAWGMNLVEGGYSKILFGSNMNLIYYPGSTENILKTGCYIYYNGGTNTFTDDPSILFITEPLD